MARSDRSSPFRSISVALLPLVSLGVGCNAPSSPEESLDCTAADSVCETNDENVGTFADEIVLSNGPKLKFTSTNSFQESLKLQQTLSDLRDTNTEILGMAASIQGGWVITTASNYYTGGTLPSGLVTWLGLLKNQGETLRAVAINAAGGYVIAGSTTYKTGGAVAQNVKDKLDQYYANNWQVRDVDITETGYVILGSGTLASYANVDTDLSQFIADRLRSKRTVQQVELRLGGGWAAVAGQEPATEGVASAFEITLKSLAKNANHISKMMIGPDSSYVVYSHGAATPTVGNTMEYIEYGLPGAPNIWEWMDSAGVPGVSIAIIEDNQVAYARSYGVIKQGEDKHVLASTPFDMASLSKFVGALTMMKLDRDPAYGFDVDNSVVNGRKVGGHIANWLNEGNSNGNTYGFPNTSVSTQLTTANFMRHQTDFVQSNGSPGFSFGSAGLSGVTVFDYLLGWDCSSGCGYNGNNFAWSSNGNGVSQPNYDSVNFLVPQAIAEDVAGKSAAQVLEDYFFTPMGLTEITGRTNSTMLSNAAWQHGASGPATSRWVFPWTFAGGIYASPSNYAELMILGLNQGKDSSGIQRLPASAIGEMFTVPVNNSKAGFGLFSDFTGTTITETNDSAFFHSGGHSNLASTYMCGNPSRDGGIVIAFNADMPDLDGDGTKETIEFQTSILNRYVDALGSAGDCR